MTLLERIDWTKEHMKEPKLVVKGEEFYEVEEAVRMKEKFEQQTPEDIGNPLEPLKVYNAFQSEVMKLELRKMHEPEKISILDYTILHALMKVLKEGSE